MSKKFFFIAGIILSILGWATYVWLTHIVDKAYESTGFDEKEYFADFPSWLAGFYKVGAVIWIVLPVAILMLIFSGYLLKKKFRIISFVVMILDLIIFLMSFMLLI